MSPCTSPPPSLDRRSLVLAGLSVACLPLRAESGGLPMATALPQHLQQALGKGEPLVVMVSLPGCPYCKIARESYLLPLWREQALPVVQVDMRSAVRLQDFSGADSTHDTLVRAWHVRLAPTVLFFGRGGTEIAKRLVGAGNPDFYGAYLEERLTTARKAIA